MKDDNSLTNNYLGEVEREYRANEFFNVKSKGTRKLQVKYGGELTLTNKLDKTTDLPDDFIKFRIRDVVNGRWIIFPAIFTSGITDNSQASYNPINYIGRPDAVHIYQNRTRNISFGFRVVALNEDDIPIIWEKMNALQGLTTPQFKQFFSEKSVTDNTRPVAPIINLTIGDMFDNTPGYFTSVSVNVANSSTWETKDGRQFPHVCDVTVEFTYIGKETPSMLGKHYEGIAGQRVEDRRKASAESIKRKEEFLKKQRDSIELRKKLANQSFADFLTENSNTPEARQRTKISGKLTNQITQGTPDFTIPENVNFNPSLTGGQQRQQGSGAYNRTNSSKVSTKFVDQVRPLSKFQTFTSLTTEQQKVKSDVMKATNGTGIL